MANASVSSFFVEFRTIVFATLVTMLIWIWAEGESVANLSVPVRVALPDGRTSDLVLDSAELTDHALNVILRFEGSTLSVDSAAAIRGSTLVLEPGTPGLPDQAGLNQVIDLRRALASLPDIARLNVPLTSVEPESLVVDSVRLATRELPIRVELAREVALASDPVPAVQHVRVRIPESVASRIPSDAQAVAFISDEQILSLRGEGLETVKATCRLPAALADVTSARFQPDTINVTLRVRQALESTKLATSVPVWFSLPPTEDSKSWEIEVLDKFLSDITVSGPAEQIARLAKPAVPGSAAGALPASGPIVVKAMVELTSDDLNNAADGKVALAIPASVPPSPAATLGPEPRGGVGSAPGGNFTLTKPVIFIGLPPNVSVLGNPVVRVRVSRVSAINPAKPAVPQGSSAVSPKPGE